MIIVSQDKRVIVNFEKIDLFQVSKVNDETSVIEIHYGDGEWKIIAEYKTEERAEEILQEIALTFGVSKNCSIMLDEVDLLFKKMARYEMPEE